MKRLFKKYRREEWTEEGTENKVCWEKEEHRQVIRENADRHRF